MAFFSSVRGSFSGLGSKSLAGVAIRIPELTTFSFTGSDQTYVVPAGATSITIALWGAGGGAGTRNSGGAAGGAGGGAGSVQGTFSVTPGETLTIRVGEGIDYPLLGANGGNTTTVWSSLAGLGVTAFGGGGVNGFGDGAGSNAGTSGYGGGASSILRSGSFVATAAGGGGGVGSGYSSGSVSAVGINGGVGGAGSGIGGTGRGNLGTFTSGNGTYAGYPGQNGGGGGGGGSSGSVASVDIGSAGQGGTNIVPAGCTGYNGSGRLPGNTGSIYYAAGIGEGMDTLTSSTDNPGAGHGRIVIFG